jgi:hypothetical protein
VRKGREGGRGGREGEVFRIDPRSIHTKRKKRKETTASVFQGEGGREGGREGFCWLFHRVTFPLCGGERVNNNNTNLEAPCPSGLG